MADLNSSYGNHCQFSNLKRFHIRFLPLYGQLGTAICVASVMTNLLTVVVLTHKRMKTPTNSILLALASLDIATCIVLLPVLIKFYIVDLESLMQLDPWYLDWGWVLYYLVCSNLSVLAHTTSMWLGATLAVFRYYIVRRSSASSTVKYRAARQRRRAVLVILGSLAGNALLIIPYLFTQTIDRKEETVDLGNRTVTIVLYQARRFIEMPYLGFYSFWMVSLVGKMIPSVVMLVFISGLLLSMRATEERRRSLMSERFLKVTLKAKQRHNSHHRATRLLVLIVTIILVAEVPHAIMQFLSRIQMASYCLYTYLGDLMDILTLCKNSVTFVLYCFMSSDFRKIFSLYYLPCQCSPGGALLWSKDDLEHQSSMRDTCSTTAHIQAVPLHISKDIYISSKIERLKLPKTQRQSSTH